jgi:putative NIF3 family GTP cyclohydrolase 1 type 2
VGTFIPGPGTNPYTGKHGRLNEVAEARIEAVVAGSNLEKVVAAVQAVHPYENMAYDVYPVETLDRNGLGRVGRLGTPMELEALARVVARKLDLPKGIRMVGDPHRNVSRVAVCTGSGSSLTADFLASGADVYISGDIHYHDARAIEEAGRGLLDVGHFASERIMVAAVADTLQTQIKAAEYDVAVSTCASEADPFQLIDVG